MSILPDVGAVVVTWNSARDIAECLKSLMAQTLPLRRIVLVDNASTDGTPGLVEREFPAVHLIRLARNEGFARGNNVGIAAWGGEWVLLLNPDASLAPDWCERLLAFAEGKPEIGMLGGVLWRKGDEYPDRTVVDSVGIEIYRSRRVRDRGSEEGAECVPSAASRVFGVCAAALLCRRSMLEDVAIHRQIFPERFFCYYEDADLAWRAWRRGWQAWIVPQAEGRHRRGGSPIGGRFSRHRTHRNRLWLIARNDRLDGILVALPEILLHEALMAARLIRYPYLWKALLETLAGLPAALGDRRALPGRSRVRPPFQPGIGFSRRERRNAVKG